QLVKKSAKQPVTFCDNYVPWLNKLKPLVEVVDFISLHTYPVWEYKHIHEAGRGIHPERVNEDAQKLYFEDLMQWTEKHHVLTYFFEAFDEPWKGSPDPNEPEKHWGLYKVDRKPKIVMQGA
nr:hypothetical protein [Chitinophagaceae bacterium]